MNLSSLRESDLYGRNDSSGFMQDQVRRLTAIVREYQRRYLPINESIIEDASLEPWMTDPSMLSPLLIEYDANIKILRERIGNYKEDFDSLQNKSKKIVEENSRLHQELRQAIENQLSTMQQSTGLSAQTQMQIEQMKRQIDTMNEEKTRATTLYEEVTQQVDDLKAEIRTKTQHLHSVTAELAVVQDDLTKARSYAESIQSTNVRLKAENEQYLKTAQIQDGEYDDLKMENRRLHSEVKTQKSVTNDLQTHLNKMKEQLKILDKDAMKKALSENSVEGTIKKLQTENFELESRVASCSKEISKLRFDKDDLEDQLGILQKKNSVLEENEYQAIIRVRESVQLVENALLEKEQAIIQNQQKSQEVARLQSSLNTITKQAEEQRKKDISAVREQSRKHISQLMEDLHFYELENAEKQTLLEKSQRHKISMEKELEKIYSDLPSEVTEAGFTLDELQRRLSKVEVSRDEALLQIDTLQGTLRRSKTKWENDKISFTNQINEYKKQLKTLKEDLTQTSDSRLTLLDEVTSLKKELLSKREDNVVLDMSCSSQVSSLKQKLELKEKEFETRLRATESTNKEAMNDLREMLSVQQKNSAKWREESRSLCQKFENAIAQLRQENGALKERNSELLQAVQEAQRKTEEIEKDYFSNQVALDKLQRLYLESDERADAAGLQVQTLLSREKQLLQDRKSLNREVDKLRLDLSRPKRQNIDQQWNNYLCNYGKEQL